MDYVLAKLAIECTWAETSGLKNLPGRTECIVSAIFGDKANISGLCTRGVTGFQGCPKVSCSPFPPLDMSIYGADPSFSFGIIASSSLFW
jgi:hypothetical protein